MVFGWAQGERWSDLGVGCGVLGLVLIRTLGASHAARGRRMARRGGTGGLGQDSIE